MKPRSKVKHRLVLVCLVAWLAAGCSSQRGWAYIPTDPIKQSPRIAKAVAVVPFVDQRPRQNKNNLGLRLIPLMPFGWQELNAPETIQGHIASGLWQFKPTEDMAKALALEVQNRHLFKEVFFTFRESDGELVLRGTLLSTGYAGTLYTYGLSIYGELLWVLGLPAGKVKNDLSIELRLEERTSGQVVWNKQYKADHDEGVYWAYAIPSDFWYDTMLKDLMPTILSDLEEVIKNQDDVPPEPWAGLETVCQAHVRSHELREDGMHAAIGGREVVVWSGNLAWLDECRLGGGSRGGSE